MNEKNRIVWMGRRSFIWTEPDPNAVAISIGNSNDFFNLGARVQRDRNRLTLNLLDYKDCLSLIFDDATPEAAQGCLLFDEDHARLILNFIREWKDSVPYVIHCEAGFSRSAAVARVVHEITGLPMFGIEISDDKFANPHVLRVLHGMMWDKEKV